ncbi:MAG: hypothetical protein Q9Q13_13425 [Acidobacteriota bacterium]|nr:hypothetical protein [Acidobacteriota bacterium]
MERTPHTAVAPLRVEDASLLEGTGIGGDDRVHFAVERLDAGQARGDDLLGGDLAPLQHGGPLRGTAGRRRKGVTPRGLDVVRPGAAEGQKKAESDF